MEFTQIIDKIIDLIFYIFILFLLFAAHALIAHILLLQGEIIYGIMMSIVLLIIDIMGIVEFIWRIIQKAKKRINKEIINV